MPVIAEQSKKSEEMCLANSWSAFVEFGENDVSFERVATNDRRSPTASPYKG